VADAVIGARRPVPRFRKPQVIEGLLEGFSGLLCLEVITCEALLRLQATALSDFSLFFGVSLRWGHAALFDALEVCGGSLSACTCYRPPRVGENGVSLRHVHTGLPAFFCHPSAVYRRLHGFAHSHTVGCTPHWLREGGQ
jgi:hypothetical protein